MKALSLVIATIACISYSVFGAQQDAPVESNADRELFPYYGGYYGYSSPSIMVAAPVYSAPAYGYYGGYGYGSYGVPILRGYGYGGYGRWY